MQRKTQHIEAAWPAAPRRGGRWGFDVLWEKTGGGNNYTPPDPYEQIGLRGMGVTKPYEFVWFRDTHATEPYFFIGV